VLIATHQSRGGPAFLAVLLPLTIAEPALIVAFHQTLLQVIDVVAIAMGMLVLGLAALYVYEERSTAVEAQSFESSPALISSRVNP
jgi:hypothetical protein